MLGDGEIDYCLKVTAGFEDDKSLVPSTHIRWLTATFNPSFSVTDNLFWPLCMHLYSRNVLIHACSFTSTQACTHHPHNHSHTPTHN